MVQYLRHSWPLGEALEQAILEHQVAWHQGTAPTHAPPNRDDSPPLKRPRGAAGASGGGGGEAEVIELGLTRKLTVDEGPEKAEGLSDSEPELGPEPL